MIYGPHLRDSEFFANFQILSNGRVLQVFLKNFIIFRIHSFHNSSKPDESKNDLKLRNILPGAIFFLPWQKYRIFHDKILVLIFHLDFFGYYILQCLFFL